MEQPQLSPPPLPEEPQVPTMSLGARLLNVFATPGDVFEHVRSAPSSTANWLVPALILIGVSWAAALLIFSQPSITQQLSEITDQAIQRQIDSSHLTEQQADQARAMGEKWAGLSSQIAAGLAPVVAGILMPFVWGLILWLLGAYVFKGDFPYMKAVEVVGLANMILVLEVIVKTLLIVGLGNLYASPGLVLLVDQFDPQNPAHAAMAAVNVMTFWVLTVRALGLSKLSGISFTKSAISIFVLWAAYTAFFIGMTTLVQAGVREITG